MICLGCQEKCGELLMTNNITEEDSVKQAGWIALLELARNILETSIDVLGFKAPERM